MSHNQAILLLGTNLGDKNLNLEIAVGLIGKRIGEIVKKTEVLETEPVGFVSENFFLNQIITVRTCHSPYALLGIVKSIEKEMGRSSTRPRLRDVYEDRIIDIDILFFNDLKFESENLTIPHPQVNTRNFVKILLRF